MDGENPTTAPEAAPATQSETTSTNTIPTPEAQAPTSQPNATTPEVDPNAWLKNAPEEFQKFVTSNGGYDKAFSKMKHTISNPQTAEKPIEATPATTQEQPQPQRPAVEQPKADGVLTLQEIATQQYFNSLASQEQYAPIAEEIRTGKIFDAMKSIGINPLMPDGSINAKQLNNFLSMYAHTKPAPTPTTPEASDNVPQYTQVVDGKITDFAQAQKILSEHGNPNREAAKAFILGQAGLTIRKPAQGETK